MVNPAGAARALARWFADHDPGAVERWRAAHFGLAVVIIVLAAGATEQALGLSMSLTFPMMAGLVGGHVLFLLTPSRPGPELAQMLRIAGAAIGFILLVALLDPKELPWGALALKVLLVPITFVALYARRFGMDWQQVGAATVITAMIVSTGDPGRREALWWAVAGAEGAVIAMALRLALRRRSALPGFEKAVADCRAAVTAALAAVGDALAEDTPLPPGIAAPVATKAAAARIAAVAALLEAPPQQRLIDREKALAYRLTVALAMVLDRLSESRAAGPLPLAIRRAALDAVRATERWTRLPPAARPFEAARLRGDAAGARRALLLTPESEEPSRNPVLVGLAGLERIAASDAELAALAAGTARPISLVSSPAPSPSPSPSAAAPAAAGTHLLSTARLLPTTRVAIQGLAATTVTSALDLGFGLDHAYWATLTVAFVLGSSFGDTVGRIRGRMIGTVAGVFAGIAVLGPLEGSPLVLAGLCILAAMVAVVTARDRRDVAAGATAFAVVLGLHLIAGLGVAGMFARIYETAIGAGIALLAARFILPVYLADPTRAEVFAVLRRCRASLAGAWPTHPPVAGRESAQSIALGLFTLMARLPTLNTESVLGRRGGTDLVRIVTLLDAVMSYMVLIDAASDRLAAVGASEASATLAGGRRAIVLEAFDDAVAGVAAAHPFPPTAAHAPEHDPRIVQYLIEYAFFSDALTRTIDTIAAALDASDDGSVDHPEQAIT